MSSSNNILTNCIHGAETGFGISALVEAGVITATGSVPPTAVAVGGLLAGAFIGCVAFNYFSKPAQPVLSSSAYIILTDDTAQFDDILREYADMYNVMINTTNNFNVDLTPALKYDLMWILALNYNNYYNFISSVQNYQQYIVNKLIQGLQPYNQNIIYSAQAYAQTIAQIQTINVQGFSGQVNNVNPIILYPLGNFGNLSYIPFSVGFGVQYQINGKQFTLAVLFDDPSQPYVACNPNTNQCNTVTFNNIIVENVPIGLSDVIPYVWYEYNSYWTYGVVNDINNGLNVTINGSSVSLGFTLDVENNTSNPFTMGNNVAILVNLSSTTTPNMILSMPGAYNGTYLSFAGAIKFLQYINNLNLVTYANDLWNYYHNMGYTQQQLIQLLEGTAFNIYFPQCNPSMAYQESQLIFNILQDLYSQGQSGQINIFPIFAGGTFTVNGQTITGYAQFNQSVVLQPGQSTNVGGILIDLNNNVYYIPPGTPITNAGQNTIVFRPDVWLVNGQSTCNFVPIPYNFLNINNYPENTVGVILDLDQTTQFSGNQQYTEEGWYVNSVLESSNNTPGSISFTPQNGFIYIPYNSAYITISNSLPQVQSAITPVSSHTLLILIIALLLIGAVAGVVISKKK